MGGREEEPEAGGGRVGGGGDGGEDGGKGGGGGGGEGRGEGDGRVGGTGGGKGGEAKGVAEEGRGTRSQVPVRSRVAISSAIANCHSGWATASR